MRVMYKYLPEPLSFHNKKPKIIVLENEKLFRKTAQSLYSDDSEELFVFSKDYKPVQFKKYVFFIGDILNYSFNNKKFITKINTDLENIANDEYYSDLCNIKGELLILANILSERFDFDIEYCDDIETSSIIKMLSFSPKNDTEEGIEKLIRFIKLMRDYVGYKFFVIQNLYLYFSDNEIEELFKTIISEEVLLLDLERYTPVNRSEYSDIAIIDRDLCVVIDK